MPNYKTPPENSNIVILTFKGHKDPGLGFYNPTKQSWWLWAPNWNVAMPQVMARAILQAPFDRDTDVLPHHFCPFEGNLLTNWCRIGGTVAMPELVAARDVILEVPTPKPPTPKPRTFFVAIGDGWEVSGKIGRGSKRWATAYAWSDMKNSTVEIVQVAELSKP